MTTIAQGIEEAFGLNEMAPSETDILFPQQTVDVELVDGSKQTIQLWPWGLGRFVQAQTILTDLLTSYQRLFAGIDVEKLGNDLSPEVVGRVFNLLTPHLRDLLCVTFTAKETFAIKPSNIRQFVDELTLAASVRAGLVMLRQNWRQVKNVLGLTELHNAKVLVSARQ